VAEDLVAHYGWAVGWESEVAGAKLARICVVEWIGGSGDGSVDFNPMVCRRIGRFAHFRIDPAFWVSGWHTLDRDPAHAVCGS
jgi:hypothetical protein